QVMEFLYPPSLGRAESDAMVDGFETELAVRGFCPWAVEVIDGARFIGFVGLHQVPDYLPCAPAVEVGWRLARTAWGRGYATEAARAAVIFGLRTLGIEEIV